MIYKCVKKDLGENILNDSLLNYILWSNGILTKKDYDDKIVDQTFSVDLNVEEKFYDFLINQVKSQNKKVVIVGDYDVDGVCATSVMYKFLRFLNLNVDYIIPNRFINGYGLKKELVDKCLILNADVIITVDNGISAKEAVDYALSKGLEVVVTDHHSINPLFVPTLPLIVNPHYITSEQSFVDYSGAVVAYLLATYTLKKYYGETEEVKEFLSEIEELAGIATIADVMPLYKGNRHIVSNLLNKIKTDTIKNKGLKVALSFIKKDKTLFDSEDLGFSLAPILNAPGRLDDASVVVKLLTEDNEEDIKQDAFYCSFKNTLRKDFTNKALNSIVDINLSAYSVNVVYIENLGEGIIGLVSGKITESTSHPSFVFTKDKNGNMKGSARSPLNYDLISGFKRVITNGKFKDDEIIAYGGHKGAMGLTVKDEETLNKLREEMSKDYDEHNTGDITRYFVPYEIRESTTNYLEDYYKKMENLEPFGEGFEKGILGSVLRPCGLIKSEKNYYSFYTTYRDENDEVQKVNFYYFSSSCPLLDEMIANPEYKREILVLYTPTRSKFNDKIYFKGNVIYVTNY